ncbi:uncharacterized protein LOC116144628 [Pistacia vera]|uniref:uncharacterized protein LOC116144628 n=1 Tax=Pistacia vera TaxID=55513 RepID=UPI001262B0C9|nr:uncharacterized protein LOC116144628 [Pistacia vera]
MENNTSISNFFIHVVGLDILEGANLKMEEARDRLDTLVRILKDSCLLTDGFTSEQFAMHDVVRAVAVTISYTDHHVFTRRNDVEREWKDKDKLKKCTKISLTYSSTVISELWHEDLDCPDLEYFYMTNMWGSNSSFEIPEDFFTVMPNLKVLNLIGMQQLLLPLSLDLLINLRTLCLIDSKIEDVAIIGKLKKLKVLSLSNSSIRELPAEIGQLTQLKLFDLSNCRNLKIIAPNVISKLLQLEELYMKGCFIQWKVEVLKELKLLSQLASLELDIKDNKMLPKDFFSKELKRYKISIGVWPSEYIRYNEDEDLRMLKLKLNSTISLEELRGFKNVKLLFLAEFSDVENNFNEFVALTPLFDEKVIFTDLMGLELSNISSGKIWDSKFPTLMSSSYQNLTRFMLKSCGKIKYVFPSSIAKSLQTLQRLEIMDCEVLEEIVAEEEGAKAAVNFAFSQINSNLEDLYLKNKLRQIIWWCRFKTLKIEYDESANIPLGLLQRFENLEVLELTSCRYEEMFSCGKDEKHMQINLRPSLASFQNLRVLNVSWCRELMKLMTPSTARSLVQLRELSVEGCEMVIEIVENEGDATTSTEIVFDNLKKLSLEDLKSLICFCSGNYSFNFSSLEELIISECPNMKTFTQGILSTPKLYEVNYHNETKGEWEKIEVENEGNDLNKTIQGAYRKEKQDISLNLKYKAFKDVNSTEICYNQHPNFFYQNLTHLFLRNCGNIKYAFPSSIAKSLHQLQELKIEDCKVLEEIVAKEEGANAVVNFVFPNITLLKLQNLPELTTFYLGIHTSKWPMLKQLVVIDCEKFTSKHMSFQENGEEGELHISEPKSHFLDDKVRIFYSILY